MWRYLIFLYFSFDVWTVQALEKKALEQNVTTPLMLLDCYRELKQASEMFLCPDFNEIADEKHRLVSYSQVAPRKILKLCDHFKEPPMFTKLPSDIVPLKRKTIDAVVKKLKTQEGFR
jgi:hypothetical protein